MALSLSPTFSRGKASRALLAVSVESHLVLLHSARTAPSGALRPGGVTKTSPFVASHLSLVRLLQSGQQEMKAHRWPGGLSAFPDQGAPEA